MPFVEPHAVALAPSRRTLRDDPFRRNLRQGFQGVLQRQQHQFQVRQVARDRQHVRRVGALRAAPLEPTALGAARQQAFKEPRFGLVLKQARAELAQDRGVKAVILERQGEQIFPFNPAAHGIGGLLIAQLLGELQDAHQRQAPGRIGGLPRRGIEIGESLIVIEIRQLVAQLQPRMPLTKSFAPDARSFGWDFWQRTYWE